MTVAFSTESSAWMLRMALAEPAPPTTKNSLRPALLIAASTPTPWSSSWFQIASICGAACSRFAAASSPDSTVNSAATRLLTSRPQSASASAKPWLRSWGGRGGDAVAGVRGQRQRVDAGDRGDDRVGLVAQPGTDVGAGRDTHAVVV